LGYHKFTSASKSLIFAGLHPFRRLIAFDEERTVMKTKFRWEKDSLGPFKVPADAYWGIHTGRALENFPISGRPVSPCLIDAYVEIKRAAAMVNEQAGLLDARPARAIRAACDDALAGRLAGQFVVDMYQAGAGTSTNMNVNEVLCNRALERLRKTRGDYAVLHPNDHVNLSQSTNDTYPAAMRLAALGALRGFNAEAMKLAASFFRLGRRYGRVVKSGRTHLVDAVPVTLGGEFRAYGSALRASLKMLKKAAAGLTELGLGGTGTGTGMNAPAGFPAKICRELARRTHFRLHPASDLQKAMQSQAPLGDTAAALRGFAVELGRIANDLRLLASGPSTGLAEIRLPAVQAGSSFMPGKVNPSILEMVNMVVFRVVGNDQTAAWAVAAGQLELNVMMPILAESLLESTGLLTAACRQMRTRCVDGITADARRCRDYAYRSPAAATILSPVLGYDRVAELARRAVERNRSIIDIIAGESGLSKAELKSVLAALKKMG
jgi:aspartate ammonia-lyase